MVDKLNITINTTPITMEVEMTMPGPKGEKGDQGLTAEQIAIIELAETNRLASENIRVTSEGDRVVAEIVREAIVEQAAYIGEEVTVDATMVDDVRTEIVDARVGEGSLGFKIRSVDTQLADIPNQTYITEKAKTADTNNALALKVDKVTGKSLSTNDYDNTEKAEVAKVVLKANIVDVNTQISSLASGSPKAVYATLALLQSAFPTGTTGTYLVTADGDLYYWNGTAWDVLVQYQSTGIAEKSITDIMVSSDSSIAFKKTDKNLINENTLITGFFVPAINGVLSVNTGCSATDYIALNPSTEYILSANSLIDQFAFYDSNKAYISGSNGMLHAVIFTTDINTAYIRVTIEPRHMGDIQLEVGSVRTNYEPYSNFIRALDIEDKISKKVQGKNLLNDNLLVGNYVEYASGRLIINNTENVTDFIPLTANQNYTFTAFSTSLIQQFAFYDVNKVFISGNVAGLHLITFIAPSNAAYGRFTIDNTQINACQLELGTVSTPYEPYGFYLEISDFHLGKITSKYLSADLISEIGAKSIITLKADVTGDFTTLRSALASITDASVYKQYEIDIYEGTYDILADYTTAELADTSFWGPIISTYVSLMGIGEKENIILKGELPDTTDPVRAGKISTICRNGTAGLKNLTITGKNVEYAVHDDWEYEDTECFIENCNFIKYASTLGTPQAYGLGTWSGMKFNFKDCYFYSEVGGGMPLYIHNEPNTANACHLKFTNCEFYNENANCSVYVASLGSGSLDTIDFIGCRCDSVIVFAEYIIGVGIDFKISGYGNDIVPIQLNSEKQNVYNFVGETREMRNSSASTILKGSLVKMFPNGHSIVPFLSTDDASMLFGIAFQDIAITAQGKNLFDKSKAVMDGQRIDETSGDYWVDIFGEGHTDYIKINPNTNYTISGVGSHQYCMWAIYDENETYILGLSGDVSSRVIPTTANAFYIRFTLFNDNLTTIQLEQGTVATTYEPYISNGGSGIIKVGGYLNINDTSLTGLVLGDKVGVVNGVLAKVTTGDYVGVVTLTEYIKLKF